MNEAVRQAVDAVQRQFPAQLGDQVETISLFGSATQGYHQPYLSDVNLLIIVQDGCDIHAVRQAFLPLWETHEAILGQPPAIAEQSAWQRNLVLNPALAQHIASQGQVLYSQANSILAIVKNDPLDALAYDVSLAMVAAAALTPNLLEEAYRPQRLAQLHSLARRLTQQAVSPTQTPAQLFATVQQNLQERLAKHPELSWSATPPAEAPPLLPGLVALYEMSDQLVMLLPDLNPDRILAVDWSAVEERLTGAYKGIHLVTPTQLRLACQQAIPVDFRLLSYNHAWGCDPLADLTIPPQLLFRDAARRPAQIQLFDLPQMYLAAPDDTVGKVIHDIQNKLMNVQLRHELLYRIAKLEAAAPPTPLPDRNAPHPERIEGIFDHCDWWANYYTAQMNETSR